MERRTVSILVVDDDTTCLSIVAAMLRKWKYEVVTVKNPLDALCTLQVKAGYFDLVVSDVYMPDMNGFELQRVITEEYELPVILMSADDQEGLAVKGLESGAAYFIVKPVSPEALKNLWQYAVMNKRSKSFVDRSLNTQSFTNSALGGLHESASSVNAGIQNIKDQKSKSKGENSADRVEGTDSSTTPKKAKVVWTNALHNRFLEAIRSIGLDRAVPKKILELMHVPGLTRENVASHLQKYRIFLKRVSDASSQIQPGCGSITSRTIGQHLVSEDPSLMLNTFSQLNQQNPEGRALASESNQNIGGHIFVTTTSDLVAASLPNQKTSSSNPLIQSGFGQAQLLCNMTNSWRPCSNAYPLYQPTLISCDRGSENLQASLHINQGSSGGLLKSTNSLCLYSPMKQVASGSVSNDLFTVGDGGSSHTSAHRNTIVSGAINQIEYPSNLTPNYAGYQLGSRKQHTSLEHGEYEVAEVSDFLDGVGSLIGKTASPMPNSHGYDQLSQYVSFSGSIKDIPNSASFPTGGPEAEVQLLPSNHVSHVSFSNERESCSLISPVQHSFSAGNNSTQQLHGLYDLNSILLNQIDVHSLAQKNGGEDRMSSNFCSLGDSSSGTISWSDDSVSQHVWGGANPENLGTSLYNSTPLPASELNEDELLLQSLLAPGPSGGDDNIQ